MESRMQKWMRRGLVFATGVLMLWTTPGCATVHLLRLTSAHSIQPERIDAAGCSADQVAIWYKASRSNHMSHATDPVHRYALLDLAQSNREGMVVAAVPIGPRLPDSPSLQESAFVSVPVLADTAAEALAAALQTHRVVVLGVSPDDFAVCRRTTTGTVEKVPCRVPASLEDVDTRDDLLRIGAATVGLVADAVTLTVVAFALLISSHP
jgi:hypothetical protein